jgi:DNA repair protein RecO (recombination protein O)
MIITTEGIVLKSIKYGETSLICHVFTRTYGKKSFIIKGVRSSQKSKQKAQLFQSGNILHLELYNKLQGQLSILKEAHASVLFTRLRENMVLACTQMFMIEVLSQIVVEEYPQEELYDFIHETMHQMDKEQLQLTLLPSWFLLMMNKLSGYHLLNNWSISNSYFNAISAQFESTQPIVPPYLDAEASQILSQLVACDDIYQQNNIQSNGNQHNILEVLVEYMKIHYPNFKNLQSLSIIRSILA